MNNIDIPAWATAGSIGYLIAGWSGASWAIISLTILDVLIGCYRAVMGIKD